MKKDILRHIRKERFLYIFVILQVVICTALFTYSLSHTDSAARAFRTLSDGTSRETVTLEAHPNTENATNLILKPDELEEIYRASDGTFHYDVSCTTAGIEGENVSNIYIVFRKSDRLDDGVAYLSDDMVARFQKGMEVFNSEIEMDGDRLLFMGNTYRIKPMPEDIKEETIITTIDGERIEMNNAVLFSIASKYGYERFIETGRNLTSYFSVDYKALENNGAILWKTVRNLEKTGDGRYTITVNDIFQESVKYQDYSIVIPSYLGKTGFLLLCIAAAGIVGTMGLITQKRMREQAIKLALGATVKYIIIEEVIEAMSVIASGCLMGFVIGSEAVRILPFDTAFPIGVGLNEVLAVVAIWLLMSAFSAGPILANIFKMKPAELLSCN